MRKLLAVLLLSFSANLTASEWQYKMAFNSFNHSEAIPVLSLSDNSWQGKYKKGNTVTSHSRLTLSASKNNWRIGLASRFDYLVQHSSDTALFFYQDKNDIKTAQPYDISLSVNHLFARGIYAAWQQQYKNIHYDITLNLWQGTHVTYGTIYGQVNTNQQGALQGELLVDYSYNKDLLFDRPKQESTSNGYSVDLKAQWQPYKNISVEVTLTDVLNQFFWKDVTHTKVTVSNSEHKDKAEALLAGKEDSIDITQRLPVQTTLAAYYHWENSKLSIGAKRLNYQWYSWVGYQYNTKGIWGALGVELMPNINALKLNIEKKDWGVSLMFDQLSTAKANSLMANFWLAF